MVKLYFVLIFIGVFTPAFAQKLAQITIDNRGNKDVITFLVDETVVLNITKDGKIIDWGTEYTTPQTGLYPKLEKYMGREDYYTADDNEAYSGNIKYIGRTLITYYTSDDNAILKGKVKTIGNVFLDYYGPYDNEAFRGNLKSEGSVSFTYYSSFDDEFYRGKIKSVGSTMLTYYGSIDDVAYRGKIKNIDRTLFTYYSSYERKEYSGMMKPGPQTVSSGGVQFIVKNF